MGPMLAKWDGENFILATRHMKEADANLVVGEAYMIEVALPRSMASHRHYFAAIAEAWRNLPESIAEEYPTPEKLRAYALCKCGFCTESRQVFTTPRDAILAAAFTAGTSEYAIVEVSGRVVTTWKPESQSIKAMGAERFRASKNAVLEFLAKMIAVPTSDLVAAGEAA